MHHGTCEDVGIFFAAKIQTIHLPSITPLVEGLCSLIVLQPFRNGTIYYHLKIIKKTHLYLKLLFHHKFQLHVDFIA